MPSRRFVPCRDIGRRRGDRFTSADDFADESDREISASSARNIERGMHASAAHLRVYARLLGGVWTDYLDPAAPENSEALTPRHAGPRPQTLIDCTKVLLDWERTQSAKLPLTINTLAIDLANGWESICRVVQGTGSTDIEFRILMLSADEALLPDDAPPEVRRWARAAGDNLELLRDGLAAYRGPKVIAVRVRAYSAVPTIHGVLARKGNSRRLAVSECRWMGGPIRHYTFGEGEYLLIDPDQCSAMEDERAVGYTERFQHLYDTGRPILSRNYPV